MIMDANLEFSDYQTLTGITSTTFVTSTNIVDLGAAGTDAWGNTLRNLLDGGNMKFNVLVGATLTTADIACMLYTYSSATGIINNGEEIVRIILSYTSSDVNYAIAGFRTSVSVPQGINMQRYLAVKYIGLSGNPSDTIVDAWLGLDMESNPTLAA